MTPTKPLRKQRDVGQTVHRVLQWITTLGTTIVGALAISWISTQEKLKDQAVRMEGVPGAVEEIRHSVNSLATTCAVLVSDNEDQDRRLNTLETRRR